jgi:hypothetical protein
LASAVTALTNLGLTATAAEINYNDITTLGTVQASKTVTADSSADVHFGDNDKITFGASNDLEIYCDGSNSVIQDTSAGAMIVKGSSLSLQNQGGTAFYLQSSDGGSTRLYYAGSDKIATTSTGIDVTGTALTDGVTVDGTLDIEEVYEYVNTFTSTTGTFTFDTTAQGVSYLTANQTANRTINFTNVNANLAVGQSVTGSILVTQGGTAYYFNAYQVDGSTVTPKWSGGSAPTEGNASSIDVYTFTIVKTADATFTVLASQTQFA